MIESNRKKNKNIQQRKKLINDYVTDNIKMLIKRHSYSYLKMAEKIGVSYSTIKSLMSKHRNFTLDEVYMVAKTFNISISSICPPTHMSSRNFKHYVQVTGDHSKNGFQKFLIIISKN